MLPTRRRGSEQDHSGHQQGSDQRKAVPRFRSGREAEAPAAGSAGVSAESSPWTAGRRAIKEADDLIRGLKYKQACDLLRKAWEPFAKAPSGPVFGDIAVKLFQATQASWSCTRMR